MSRKRQGDKGIARGCTPGCSLAYSTGTRPNRSSLLDVAATGQSPEHQLGTGIPARLERQPRCNFLDPLQRVLEVVTGHTGLALLKRRVQALQGLSDPHDRFWIPNRDDLLPNNAL